MRYCVPLGLSGGESTICGGQRAAVARTRMPNGLGDLQVDRYEVSPRSRSG